MTKDYKALVFFDLDGTLLNEHSEISQENIVLIQELKERNILPLVASGRAPFEIEKILEHSELNSYVSLNGQYVKVEDEIIYEQGIEKAQIEALIALIHELNHSLAFYTNTENALLRVDESARLLYELDNAPLPRIDETFYLENNVLMLYLFTQDQHLDQVYREKLGHQFSFFRDSPYSIAVVPKGISKKAGIKGLIKHMGTGSIPSYAFGDGGNDVAMFEAVDVKIAMENGTDELKALADFVTTSNIEHGILNCLKEYNLL